MKHPTLIIIVALVALVVLWRGCAPAPPLVVMDDGTANTFTLALVEAPTTAAIGEAYGVTVTVTNAGDAGAMVVQCSLLDPRLPWLTELQARGTLETVQNCVANESFTSTQRVTLAANASTTVPFAVTVPDIVSPATLYCAAYERCWTPTQTSLESSHITQAVTLTAPRSTTTESQKLTLTLGGALALFALYWFFEKGPTKGFVKSRRRSP